MLERFRERMAALAPPGSLELEALPEAASARNASARPDGFRPPAFVTIRTRFSTASPRHSSIWRRNVRAYPRDGSRSRSRPRISMVSSAR